MIKQEDKDRILQAADIVDVIGQFVNLKRRGVNYIGLCPFHNEKTPSFNVNSARGIFKCFGCGEGGDVLTFLIKYEHFTYLEALRWLANRYSIQIEEQQQTPETIASQNERDALFAANELAQKYFHEILLQDKQGQAIGLSYFRERELTQETIKQWGLGYCKESWTDFTDHATKQGYSVETLVKAGLTIEKEGTDKRYDRFRGRVMFPIYSISGRPIGFTGRILTSDKTKAKYVNSPESLIYSKGKVLFGLHLAKNHIAKEDNCYLVEGNMDAVMMSQQGVKNVVATSGTALTEDQIRLLKRYSLNVTLLYDGDKAGIKAAFRAIDMFLSAGLKIKIVLFPDGEDPDSFATKNTQAEFQRYIVEEAHDFIIFKTNLLLTDAQDDPIKRAALVREILMSISKIPDAIERIAYIQKCSSLLEMKEEMLAKELAKIIRTNSSKQTSPAEPYPKEDSDISIPESSTSAHQPTQNPYPNDNQERGIIKLLLNYSEVVTRQKVIIDEDGTIEEQSFMGASYIISDLKNENINFENPIWQGVFEIYYQYINQHNALPSTASFTSSDNEELREEATALMFEEEKYIISSLWQSKYELQVPNMFDPDIVDEHIKQTLLYFKWSKIEQRRSDVLSELKHPNSEEKTQELLTKIKLLNDALRIIRGELHNIVR